MKVKLLGRVLLFGTPWTVAYQVPLSMGFSRQGYWSGLPRPSLGDLPNPGISDCRQTLYRLSHQGSPSPQLPGEAQLREEVPHLTSV